MSVIRTEKRSNPYTMLDNSMISDKRLTFGARGLLAYLLSKPTNWTVRIRDLVANNPRGADHIYSLLKELREYGYARIVVKQTENGRLAGKEWVIQETPDDPADIGKIPTSGKSRHRENPDIGKNRNTGKPRRIVNTDSLVRTEEEKEKKADPSQATAQPEPDPVWTDGVKWLESKGCKNIRPYLGKLCKDYGSDAVVLAIDQARTQNPVEPKSYLLEILKSPKRRRNGVDDPSLPNWLRGAI